MNPRTGATAATTYSALLNDHAEQFLLKLKAAPQAEGPGTEFVTSSRIDICLKSGFSVDNVEMTTVFPLGFRGDCLRRRHIEIGGGEDMGQLLNVRIVEKHNEINIVGEARLPVKDRSDAARDHVTNVGAVEGAHEQQEELRFGH